MNVCKLKRKKQAFEIAKINSCCFHTFPVAILEPFGRTPSWRVACGNTKLFNFERYILLKPRIEFKALKESWHPNTMYLAVWGLSYWPNDIWGDTPYAPRVNLEKAFKMNLVDVTRLSNGPISDLICWLQRENLIANPLRCLPCNRGMALTAREANHVDGYLW